MNSFTSFNQGRRLVKNGLDVFTADMWAEKNKSTDKSFSWHTPRFIPMLDLQMSMDEQDRFFTVNKRNLFKTVLPVWSLAAIMQQLPKQLKKDSWIYELMILPKDDEWNIVYGSWMTGILYKTHAKDLLDAAVDMLCLLLIDKIIKKTKNGMRVFVPTLEEKMISKRSAEGGFVNNTLIPQIEDNQKNNLDGFNSK